MGQKTNPIGNRLGLIRGWDSNWYGGDDFGEKLSEDAKIRKYLKVRLSKASVSKIDLLPDCVFSIQFRGSKKTNRCSNKI